MEARHDLQCDQRPSGAERRVDHGIAQDIQKAAAEISPDHRGRHAGAARSLEADTDGRAERDVK